MSDRSKKPFASSGDDLATLFGNIAARERPSEAAEAAAFAALHAQWRNHTASRRRKLHVKIAAVLAASLLAGAVGLSWVQGPAPSVEPPLATVELAQGREVTWRRGDRAQAQPLGARRNLGEGERLATGPDSRLALRWHDGGSLRLDASSRVELVSAEAVRLTAGRLYFDSAGGNKNGDNTPALAVQTPAGDVVHIGTQFMVSVASDEVVLSVREGQVMVTGDGFELVVATNQQVGLRSDGTRELAAIDSHGEHWAWAADVAPQIELDGRTAFDAFAWAARETGRRVVYATPAAQARARDDMLRGIDRRTPSGILTLLPHLTGLVYEIRDDVIFVSEP